MSLVHVIFSLNSQRSSVHFTIPLDVFCMKPLFFLVRFIIQFRLIRNFQYVGLRLRTPFLIRRKKAKTYGTEQLIEGVYAAGQKVIIVEDVVTSGGFWIELQLASRYFYKLVYGARGFEVYLMFLRLFPALLLRSKLGSKTCERS